VLLLLDRAVLHLLTAPFACSTYDKALGAVVYHVQTTYGANNEKHTEKLRFAQFSNLREMLKRCYDNLQWAHTKQLPAKTLMTRTSPEFIAERIHTLQRFMDTVMSLPGVKANYVLLHFLGLVRGAEVPEKGILGPNKESAAVEDQRQSAVHFAYRFGTDSIFSASPGDNTVEEMLADNISLTEVGGSRISGRAHVVKTLGEASESWKLKVLASCQVVVPPVVLGTSELVAETEYLFMNQPPGSWSTAKCRCVERVTVGTDSKITSITRKTTVYGV